MSEMERIKAVRLRLPNEISSMKFRNEKYDCDDDIQEYLDRPEFSDIIDWKKPGKFMSSYGASLIKVNGDWQSLHEYYIDFLLDRGWDDAGDFTKSRELTDNELVKYIPKFKAFFEAVKLPCPELSKETIRVVEYCYYNGSDAPVCFDTTTDPFYDEV